MLNLLKFFSIGIILACALNLLVGEAVVRDIFAKDTVTSSITLASDNESSINPQQLITEALQIIEQSYMDDSFNGLDWQQVKAETLSRQYTTSEEAYEAIDSVLNRLGDSATRFLTAEQFADFLAKNSGEDYVGVGLPELLSLDYDDDEQLRIITPMPNSPAAEAGLQSGDRVTAIDGVATNNLSLTEVAMKLRGAEGSIVNLTVYRDGSTFDVQLKRDIIAITPTVRTESTDLESLQTRTEEQLTGGLRRRWANKPIQTFPEALEAFRTAISFRFVEWLDQNRDVFAAYKASLGFVWA